MKNVKSVHFLGVGGISMSALALILFSFGYKVSGSDKVRSKVTDRLALEGIDVCIDGVSDKILGADIVVASASIPKTDKEYVLAQKLGKKIISRAELLGKIAKKYKKVISVAGSHGKTTTTGMIAQIFLSAGKNPTIHIGGNMPGIKGNVFVGGNDYFITEACEYVDSFLKLRSDISIILNIQNDHLDYFKTFKNINRSFSKFAKNTKRGGLIIFNGDDKSACKRYSSRSISFSMAGKGVLEARNIKEHQKGKYRFDCYFLGSKLMRIKLGVYGRHNIYNALASICTALEENISIDAIKKGLLEFSGIERRFEESGEFLGAKVINDYAHHPTEIRAVIDLAKSVTSGEVFVVFQPHTYSRTKTLLEDFKSCFLGAKEVCVFKVYPARETPDQGINEKELARQISLYGQKAFSFDDYAEMTNYLSTKLKRGDTLLVLGAGDIVEFCGYLKSRNIT